MKIRTDFVTNSSSSNYVTICMKNPKLAELICAARASEEIEDWDTCNDFYSDRLDIDESEQTVKLKLEISHIIEHDPDTQEDMIRIGYPPENLSGLSKSLLKLLKEIREYQFPDYDFAKICEALEKNGEDIIAGTESVDWTYNTSGRGEANLYHWFWVLSNYIAKKENLDYRPSSAGLLSSFHYDKENGESLNEERFYTKPHGMDFADNDMKIEADFDEDDEEVRIDSIEDGDHDEHTMDAWNLGNDLTEVDYSVDDFDDDNYDEDDFDDDWDDDDWETEDDF